MPDLEQRLLRCFAAVFPGLPPETIQVATRGQLQDWESLASITLVGVIEEEFGISIELLDLDDLNGFQDFLAYVETRVP